jgi:hypothetical protein
MCEVEVQLLETLCCIEARKLKLMKYGDCFKL